MKFPTRESEDGTGCRRSTQTGKHVLEGSRTTRGGGRPQNVSAADLVFTTLLLIGSFALGFMGAVHV